MAEILLSLTIIGVVAAITLPSLTGNVNERVWNTQRKALYARFSQAIALMPQLNGYGSYVGSNTGLAGSYNVSVTTDTAAEAFLTEGLSKVLKINNICDSEHLTDCGIPTSYTTMAGSTKTFPKKMSELNRLFNNPVVLDADTIYSNPQNNIDTKAAAFETQNGESVAVFYNPQCQADLQEVDRHHSQPKMFANFIYDLNGSKGPNAVGKDIGFITALYASDPVVVAPMPLASNAQIGSTVALEFTEAQGVCSTQDSESRLPNKDEASALFYNRDVIGNMVAAFWTSSPAPDSKFWNQNFDIGFRFPDPKQAAHYVRCIKR